VLRPTEQRNSETTDHDWHWLSRRDNLEWRLAFRDRIGGHRAAYLAAKSTTEQGGKVVPKADVRAVLIDTIQPIQ
jgi:hypothetical protein